MDLPAPDSRSLLSRLVTVVGLAVVAAGVLWLVAAGGDDGGPDTGVTTSTVPVTTVAPTTTAAPSTTTTTTTTVPLHEQMLSALVAGMSLRDKALQLLVVGGAGADLLGVVEQRVGSGCVGGVFLTEAAGNWSVEPDGTVSAAQISAPAVDCQVAPLVATDAEAGTRVLKVPVAPLAHPHEFGVVTSVDLPGVIPEFTARSTRFAEDLAAAGVHLNLGVVVDVDVDADHYMARQRRSFGGDPVVVQAFGEAMVTGHCNAGVAAVLKHFPNQGATLADPHLADSVSSNTLEQWRTFGAVPYIETSAPAVMTGHIRYPGVDGDRPASLSAEITEGWLRGELGFDGVVITDDLASMRGVTEEGTAGARAVASIEAGADLVLFVSHAGVEQIVSSIVERADADPAFSARVDASLDRLLRLKAALGLVAPLDPDRFPLC